MCEDLVHTERGPEGMGVCQQPERGPGRCSVLGNSVPVSMSQQTDEGQQEVGQKILLTFMGLQPLSLNKVQKQQSFYFAFVLVSFCPPE